MNECIIASSTCALNSQHLLSGRVASCAKLNRVEFLSSLNLRGYSRPRFFARGGKGGTDPNGRDDP
jgi:hypothetical protein